MKVLWPLLETLSDPDEGVRKEALEVIHQLSEHDRAAEVAAQLSVQGAAARDRGAQAIGAPSWDALLDRLIDLLGHADHWGRRMIGHLLAQMKSEEVAQRVIELLSDDHMHVRRAAVWALSSMRRKEAIPYLADIVRNREENRWLRNGAIRVLARYEDECVSGILLEALEDPDEELSGAAAAGLAPIKSEALIEPLVDRLKRGDGPARKQTLEILAEIPSKKVLPVLVEHMGDEDRTIRRLAVRSLGKSGLSEAPALLARALDDPDPDVRWAASNGLARAKATDTLIQVLQKGTSEARQLAARALGIVKDPNTVRSLIQAAQDEETEVRQSAAKALAEIRTEEALPTLVRLSDDPDGEVRWMAVSGLGRLGSEEAMAALKKVLRDEDRHVRWLARRFLKAHAVAE